MIISTKFYDIIYSSILEVQGGFFAGEKIWIELGTNKKELDFLFEKVRSIKKMADSSVKYYYKKATNSFVDKAGNLAPKTNQKLLDGKTEESQAILKGINKAFEKYLVW